MVWSVKAEVPHLIDLFFSLSNIQAREEFASCLYDSFPSSPSDWRTWFFTSPPPTILVPRMYCRGSVSLSTYYEGFGTYLQSTTNLKHNVVKRS